MSANTSTLLERNTVFGWLALATSLLLSVPLIAMQFTPEVNWTASDFAVMAALLFGMGSLFVLIARKVPRQYRTLLAVGMGLLLCYIWAELAVGIFTNLGS